MALSLPDIWFDNGFGPANCLMMMIESELEDSLVCFEIITVDFIIRNGVWNSENLVNQRNHLCGF